MRFWVTLGSQNDLQNHQKDVAPFDKITFGGLLGTKIDPEVTFYRFWSPRESLFDSQSSLFDSPNSLFDTPNSLFDTPNLLFDTQSLIL